MIQILSAQRMRRSSDHCSTAGAHNRYRGQSTPSLVTLVDMSRDSGSSRLKRAFKRLAASPAELEADGLRQQSEHQGCVAIDSVGDREIVTVFGHVKAVSLAPRAGAPTLEADVFDGSAVLTLVWLGRRKIIGIKPGVELVATGRVSFHDGRRVIFNPRYELRV